MSIPVFTPNYPPDGSSLGSTKVPIRQNLDGTFQVFSVDHQNQNQSQPGYHTVVHLVNQGGSNPSPVGLTGELYCRQINSVNTDEALFYQSGGGKVAQLTMNVAPSPNSPGYSYLPGGMLVQWGTQAATSNSTGTVTLPLSFPNGKFFGLQATPLYSIPTIPSSAANVSFGITNSQKFSWAFYTISGSYTGFFWVAIGN